MVTNDLLTNSLLGIGSALMRPRSQGGGFAAVGDAALQAQKLTQDAQLQKLYRDAQIQQMEALAQDRRAKTEQTKAAAMARAALPNILNDQTKAPQDKYLALITAGFPEAAAKAMIDPTLGKSEVARTVEVRGPNGEPMVQQLDKTGLPVGQPMPKAVAAKFIGTGGKTIGVNEYTSQPTGVEFAHTQSPDSVASNRVAIRGQDLTNARGLEQIKLQKDVIGAGKAPAGYRIGRDGLSLEFIPGGPADPALKPGTEDEKKSAGYAIRMEDALKTIKEVTSKNPRVSTPEPAGTIVGRMLGDAAGNIVTTSDRQRVEAAQLDGLDAALTLATGAAYTKEQLKGLAKSYFAQIGDSEAVKADKQARLEKVIETARIRAGSQAPKIDAIRSGAKPPTADDPLGLR